MSRYGYIIHSELYHHGIKGQKWGIRRYQNKDGSLTPEGKKKYKTSENFNKIRSDRKSKIKKYALASIGPLAVAALIGGGTYLYNKKINPNSSLDKNGQNIKKKYGVNSKEFQEYLNEKHFGNDFPEDMPDVIFDENENRWKVIN